MINPPLGWTANTLPSHGEFDKRMSILTHDKLSLRILVADGRATMHNKAGDYLGEYNIDPVVSSSIMPVVRQETT